MLSFLEIYSGYISVVSLLLNFFLGAFVYFNKKSHDRKLLKLKQELSDESEIKNRINNSLLDLEIEAGRLKSFITSHIDIDVLEENFHSFYNSVMEKSGALTRYEELNFSVREFCAACGLLANAKQANDSPQKLSADVANKYKKLLEQCDNVRKNV